MSEGEGEGGGKVGLSRRGFIGATGAAAALIPALANAQGATAAEAPAALGPGPTPLSFGLNGKAVRLEIEPRETLAEVLLYRVGLTGTKVACDRGACGACTVLVDGTPRASCLCLGLDVEGAQVTTIEGVSEKGLNAVQSAMHAADGLQCGYCIPGFVMCASALFQRNSSPSSAEIKDALAGNLCRCGSQPHIVEALTKLGGKR
ncbi:MAG: (2Fe-2S)-binding protein [Myxococcota bacterium]